MLKPLFYRFSLLLVSLLVFQFAGAQDIKVGVRAGVLLANLDITPTEEGSPEFKNQTGLQVAVPVEIGLGKMFAIQPELMYGLQGTRFDQTINETSGGSTSVGFNKGSIKVQTLEIPVLAKIKFGPEAFKIHVLAGPSVGFGLSGKYKTDFALKVTENDGTVSFDQSGTVIGNAAFVKDGYKNSELGEQDFPFARTTFNLHLGAGFSVNVGNMSVFLDGRYIIGLNDVFPDEEDTDASDELTGKSQRIGISAGILFPL